MLVSVEPRFPPLTLAKASGADPGAPRHLSQPSFRFLQKSPPFENVQRTGLVISAREPPFRFLQKSPPFENDKRTGLVISANAWGFCREHLFFVYYKRLWLLQRMWVGLYLLQTCVTFAETTTPPLSPDTSEACGICRNHPASPLDIYKSFKHLQRKRGPPGVFPSFGLLRGAQT